MKRFSSPRNGSHQRGFTLIELMVVIAVIMILIRIFLPTLQRAREAGRATQCVNNLKQIYLAMNLYAADWGVWPNDGTNDFNYEIVHGIWIGERLHSTVSSPWNRTPLNVTTHDTSYGGNTLYYGALAKYINATAVQTGVSSWVGRNDSIYMCPEVALARRGTNDDCYHYLRWLGTSYSMNAMLNFNRNWSAGGGNYVNGGDDYPKRAFYKPTIVKYPAGTYLFFEARGWNSGSGTCGSTASYVADSWCPNDGSDRGWKCDGDAVSQAGMSDRTSKIHRGGGHHLFCDGHVVWKPEPLVYRDFLCCAGFFADPYFTNTSTSCGTDTLRLAASQ